VADFGLAKLIESGGEDSNFESAAPGASSTMTRSSKVLGTLVNDNYFFPLATIIICQ